MKRIGFYIASQKLLFLHRILEVSRLRAHCLKHDQQQCNNMQQPQITKDYLQAVKAIKQAILESRCRAIHVVNMEPRKI